MKTNIIYNTSCLPVMQEVDDESIDLVFTDPPYYQHRAKNVKGLKKHKDVVTEFEFDNFKTEKDYLLFMEDVLKELYRVSKHGASAYLFCADDFVSYLNRLISKTGFQLRKVIHWHKTNPFPAISTRKMFANSMELIIHFSKGSPKTWNMKGVNEMHNFIEAPICMGNERTDHKTQKPLSVCLPFIEISSHKNDLILDPFIGSGTTAVAAIQSGRKYIGYEISASYYNLAMDRLSNLQSS